MSQYITQTINTIHLAWMEIKARYAKSKLGPVWMPLGNAISIIGLGVIWGSLLKENLSTFLLSLATGLVIWQFISNSILESCDLFITHGFIIRNVKVFPLFFTIKLLLRHFINLLHNIPMIILIMFFYNVEFSLNTSLSIIGIIIVALNMVWISFLVSMICARFRDISYAITSFMPIIFFITPVIFRADHVPASLHFLINLNPFTHFINIIRQPIINQTPDITSYVAAITILILGYAMAYQANKRNGKSLAFWV